MNSYWISDLKIFINKNKYPQDNVISFHKLFQGFIRKTHFMHSDQILLTGGYCIIFDWISFRFQFVTCIVRKRCHTYLYKIGFARSKRTSIVYTIIHYPNDRQLDKIQCSALWLLNVKIPSSSVLSCMLHIVNYYVWKNISIKVMG